MMVVSQPTWGHVAYNAYRKASKGVSLISGAPLPQYCDLSPELMEAWESTGGEVIDFFCSLGMPESRDLSMGQTMVITVRHAVVKPAKHGDEPTRTDTYAGAWPERAKYSPENVAAGYPVNHAHAAAVTTFPQRHHACIRTATNLMSPRIESPA